MPMACREKGGRREDPGPGGCLWLASPETFRARHREQGCFRGRVGAQGTHVVIKQRCPVDLCPVTGTTWTFQSWSSQPSTGDRQQTGQRPRASRVPPSCAPPSRLLAQPWPLLPPGSGTPYLALWLVPRLCPPCGLRHRHLPGSGELLRSKATFPVEEGHVKVGHGELSGRAVRDGGCPPSSAARGQRARPPPRVTEGPERACVREALGTARVTCCDYGSNTTGLRTLEPGCGVLPASPNDLAHSSG